MTDDERCEAILVEARGVLAGSEWIRWRSAEDKNGKRISPISLKVKRRCLGGSILEAAVRVTGQRLTRGDADRIAAMLGFANRYQIALWNDGLFQTKAKVLAHVDAVLAWRGRPQGLARAA